MAYLNIEKMQIFLNYNSKNAVVPDLGKPVIKHSNYIVNFKFRQIIFFSKSNKKILKKSKLKKILCIIIDKKSYRSLVKTKYIKNTNIKDTKMTLRKIQFKNLSPPKK